MKTLKSIVLSEFEGSEQAKFFNQVKEQVAKGSCFITFPHPQSQTLDLTKLIGVATDIRPSGDLSKPQFDLSWQAYAFPLVQMVDLPKLTNLRTIYQNKEFRSGWLKWTIQRKFLWFEIPFALGILNI